MHTPIEEIKYKNQPLLNIDFKYPIPDKLLNRLKEYPSAPHNITIQIRNL